MDFRRVKGTIQAINNYCVRKCPCLIVVSAADDWSALTIDGGLTPSALGQLQPSAIGREQSIGRTD